jgi:hypothetical protein
VPPPLSLPCRLPVIDLARTGPVRLDASGDPLQSRVYLRGRLKERETPLSLPCRLPLSDLALDASGDPLQSRVYLRGRLKERETSPSVSSLSRAGLRRLAAELPRAGPGPAAETPSLAS